MEADNNLTYFFLFQSEFNLLYHEGKAVVIDVSQSVEHDHPNALEFLRKDLTNINEFFRKRKINVLTVKELFDFVVDPTIERGKAEEKALVSKTFYDIRNFVDYPHCYLLSENVMFSLQTQDIDDEVLLSSNFFLTFQEALSDRASIKTEDEFTVQQKIEEEVFKQIFIPRQLDQVHLLHFYLIWIVMMDISKFFQSFETLMVLLVE